MMAKLDLEGADPEVSFYFAPQPYTLLDVAVIHYRRDTEKPAMTAGTKENLQVLITRTINAWQIVGAREKPFGDTYTEEERSEFNNAIDKASKLSGEMWALFHSLPWDDTREEMRGSQGQIAA